MDENNSAKPYDLTAIYQLCENNKPFMAKLLVVFKEATSTDLAALKTAAAQGNWTEAGGLAHKMKSAIAHFGVTSLKEALQNLEHQGDSDPQYLRSLVSEVDSVVQNVFAHLAQEFPEVFS
jgi:HPt (histidine-containing phosphotransfer) domain-containing protein